MRLFPTAFIYICGVLDSSGRDEEEEEEGKDEINQTGETCLYIIFIYIRLVFRKSSPAETHLLSISVRHPVHVVDGVIIIIWRSEAGRMWMWTLLKIRHIISTKLSSQF